MSSGPATAIMVLTKCERHRAGYLIFQIFLVRISSQTVVLH